MAVLSTEKKVKLEHMENMIAVAIADGSFEEEEKKFLADKALEFGLSSQEVESILQNPETLQSEIPKNEIDREEQLADAVYMSMINGEVNPKEYELCIQLAKKLDFNKEDVDNIIELITKLWKYDGQYGATC